MTVPSLPESRAIKTDEDLLEALGVYVEWWCDRNDWIEKTLKLESDDSGKPNWRPVAEKNLKHFFYTVVNECNDGAFYRYLSACIGCSPATGNEVLRRVAF